MRARLIGKVAHTAGLCAPISFGAAFVAGFTAFSYTELSARFPKSVGEATYVREGLGLNWLATAVGWSVVGTGIVSSATIARGFAGYLGEFVDVAQGLAIASLVIGLAAMAAWGIR